MTGERDATPQPLDGVRVLDLSTILAAPFATTLLADFGADVIKVESPGDGDSVRGFPPIVEGQSLPWRVLNRNKRGITINLHEDAGRDVVRRLGARCDVIVTNFRPSTLERWGLDYPDWTAVRADIIMLHLTAYGRTGPWREKPGFARVAEAFAGLTNITGYPDRPPLFNGYPLGDAMGGLFGAYSILLAIVHHQRTGEGQLVDLALYEPILRILEDMFVGYDATGVVKTRTGNAQQHSCPNDLFPTRDGRWIVLPASTKNMWRRLCSVLEDPGLEAYDTTPKRVANREFVDGRVAAFTSQHDAAELVDIFERAEVACGQVLTAPEIIAHEQVVARENLVRVHDGILDRELLVQAPAPRLSRTPGSIRRPAPRLGEHVDEVLGGLLEMSEEEIAKLREIGAV